MNRYEYVTSVITHGLLGRKGDEIDRVELERELNRMGSDGWELVRVMPDMALHGEKDGHLLLLSVRPPEHNSQGRLDVHRSHIWCRR